MSRLTTMMMILKMIQGQSRKQKFPFSSLFLLIPEKEKSSLQLLSSLRVGRIRAGVTSREDKSLSDDFSFSGIRRKRKLLLRPWIIFKIIIIVIIVFLCRYVYQSKDKVAACLLEFVKKQEVSQVTKA